MTFNQILINQYSQKLISPPQKIYGWFDNLSKIEKKECLSELFFMVKQAHPNYEDLLLAIEKAPVNARCTPAMMLKNEQKPFLTFGVEILNLPPTESRNSFSILLELFVIADSKRKIICGDSCNHWWHKDLSRYKTI